MKTIKLLIVLIFLIDGATKLLGLDFQVQAFMKLGYPAWFLCLIGLLEYLGAVGMISRKYRRAASIGLLVIMAWTFYALLARTNITWVMDMAIVSTILLFAHLAMHRASGASQIPQRDYEDDARNRKINIGLLILLLLLMVFCFGVHDGYSGGHLFNGGSDGDGNGNGDNGHPTATTSPGTSAMPTGSGTSTPTPLTTGSGTMTPRPSSTPTPRPTGSSGSTVTPTPFIGMTPTPIPTYISTPPTPTPTPTGSGLI